MKLKSKNIYIRSVKRGGRKTCPSCKLKLEGRSIYSVGEYIRAKWHKAGEDFCEECCHSLLDTINEFESKDSERIVIINGYAGEKIPDRLLCFRIRSFLCRYLKSIGLQERSMLSGVIAFKSKKGDIEILYRDSTWLTGNALTVSLIKSEGSIRYTKNFTTQEDIFFLASKLEKLKNLL